MKSKIESYDLTNHPFYTFYISAYVDYEIKNKYYSAIVRLCVATSIDKVASHDRELLDGVILVALSDEKVSRLHIYVLSISGLNFT